MKEKNSRQVQRFIQIRIQVNVNFKDMPFKSKKQMRYMFANHPDIAKRWAEKYGTKIVRKGKATGKKKVKSSR